MKFFLIFFVILSLLFQSACGPLKYKKVSAKDYPPDPRERVKKNMEEGRGFRIMGGNNKGTTYDFASSNPLWRATLDTLDFMPLVSANYSGGIVITDWYSEDNSPNESIKISVRFLSNEVRVDALDIKIFSKKCSSFDDCSVSENKGVLIGELKKKILQKAAVYDTEIKAIQKKRRKVPKVKKTTKKQRRKKANK